MTDPNSPLPTSTLAPLYVSGSPASTLGDAIEATAQASTGQRVKSEARFWSTPSRPQSSAIREVLEVTFNSPQRINYVDFLLARFPQSCHAQWFDSVDGVWKDCTSPGSRTRTESIAITNSVPAVINPAVSQSAVHPQHYGAGHWVSRQLAISPVTTTRIRLVLARGPGVAPQDVYGSDLPYSLGVKDLTAGYAVGTKEDVPRLPMRTGSKVEHEPFLRTRDVLGSPVEYFMREVRASNLLEGKPWRCGPQPTSGSVVSLHLDVRGTDGLGQVVDRFSIDPLYSGPTMNLYYTEDVPDGDFESGQAPLTNGVGDYYLGPIREIDGISFGSGQFLYVTNDIPKIDTSRPYTTHLSIRMGFASADPAPGASTQILSFLSGVLSWQVDSADSTDRGFTISGSGGSYKRVPLDFETGDIVNLSIHSDATSLTLIVNDQYIGSTSRNGYSGFGYSVLGGASDEAEWKLLRLAVHEENPSEEAVAAFNADPETFVDGSEYYQDSTGHERNAVLRYSPRFITQGDPNLEPYGFIGGRGEATFDVEWTPINRDFALRRGIIEFDPVRATYFKFEFTNLTPEPYEVVGPVWREVKTFPASMTDPHQRAFTLEYSGHEGGSGIRVAQTGTDTATYPDSVRVFYQLRKTETQSPYAPTEVIYSSDPTIAARLRKVGGYFNFTSWNPYQRRRFWRRGRHRYVPVRVKFEQRMAYFVGLKSLSMLRVDYTANEDTARYIDHFLDDTFIESGSSDWTVIDGTLRTPQSGDPAESWVAESRTLESRSNVTAVQFASVQTPAVQILPDPDFVSEDAHWSGYGDTEITPSGDYNGVLGTTLKVVRGGLGSSWDALEFQYPTWDFLEDSDPAPLAPTWTTIQTDPDGADFGGVTCLDPVNAKAGETIHAAARVYVASKVAIPLTVEIFDWAKPEVVYASAAFTPKPGEVSEWYASYRVGNSGDYDGLSWAQVTSDPDALPNGDDGSVLWSEMEGTGLSWSDQEQSFTPFEGEVGVRVVQNGYSRDTFYVDNISAFIDSIEWEFSNDGGATFTRVEGIRNNPRGIFVFPDPSPTVGGLRWRVTGRRPDLAIGGMVIRPRYDSMPIGVPYRESSQIRGPIDSAYDHMPPITADPWFHLWDSPVPQDWWYTQRQWSATAPLLG